MLCTQHYVGGTDRCGGCGSLWTSAGGGDRFHVTRLGGGCVRKDDLHEAQDGDLLTQLDGGRHKRRLCTKLRGVRGAESLVRLQIPRVERHQQLV